MTEDPATGEYVYGDGGVETRDVNTNVTETISASNGAPEEPSLRVGINTGGVGTINIDGANSVLHMVANGSTTVGMSTVIGRNDGTGTMTITNGGAFLMEDLIGDHIENDPIFTDEFFQIGRDGGTGTLTVDNSSFTVRGNAPGMQVGRSGTGTVNVVAGATFLLDEAQGDGDGPGVNLQIGRGVNGVGEFNIDAATATLDASLGGFAGLQIGRDFGLGEMNITNAGTLAIIGGGDGENVQIGRGYGEGRLNVTGAGSNVLLSSSSDGFANVRIGASGGDGELNVSAGATFTVNDTNGSNALNVGVDTDSFGKLVVDGTGSTVLFDSDGTENTFASIGADDGEGLVIVRNGGMLHLRSENFAGMEVGKGGEGIVEVGPGGTLKIEATDVAGGANMVLGANGGSGQLWIRGGQMQLITENFASFQIGTEFNHTTGEAGYGFLLIDDGGSLIIDVGMDNDDGSNMDIGGNGDSYGEVIVRDGSTLNMDLDDNDKGSIFIGGHGTGEGRLAIIGSGSQVIGLSYVQVGYNPTDMNSQPGGKGELEVTRGGVLNANNVSVGTGGTISGVNGTVTTDYLELTTGGTMDLADGVLSAFTITGDFNVTGGGNMMSLDISSLVGMDQLNVGGSVDVNGGLGFTLNAINGFTFGVGQTLVLLAANSVSSNPGMYTATVTGQNAQFAYAVGNYVNGNEIALETLNSGVSGGVATLDFGLPNGPGNLTYNSLLDRGTATGGRFGANGASVYKIDVFNGTDGNDVFTVTGTTVRAFKFNGRGGNDTIGGGVGADDMTGGNGNDTFIVNSASDIVRETGTTGVETVKSSITFSLANTTRVFGTVEHLTLTGTGNGTGSGGVNTITGSATANTLDGGLGNDILKGMNGNDILIGNAGKDTMTGGLHNDIFRFLNKAHSVGALMDVISDFDDSGNDTIDVGALFGVKMVYRHNLAFTAAGQVRINDIAGGDVIVEVNTGGTLAADFSVRLTNTLLTSMTATDFIL